MKSIKRADKVSIELSRGDAGQWMVEHADVLYTSWEDVVYIDQPGTLGVFRVEDLGNEFRGTFDGVIKTIAEELARGFERLRV